MNFNRHGNILQTKTYANQIMQDLDFEFLAFTAAKQHWHGLTQGEVGSAVSCNTDLVFTKKSCKVPINANSFRHMLG